MTVLRCDVAVVGGGIVGAAAALALQRQGIRAALVERSSAPRPGPDYDLRVYAITPAAQAFLERLGVWPALAAGRLSPYRHMRVWEQSPQAALSFDAADLRAPALGHIVENEALLAALWQALDPALLCSGSAVADLVRDERGVRLGLADGRLLTAKLLVAADGRDSPLRAQLGIECLGGRYDQDAVVCHVQTTLPHRATCWQRFLPSGPLAFLPLADGRSSIVWSTTGAADTLALDDADFCQALGEASQQVLGPIIACTRRLSFPLGVQHAETYVAERAVLIGDAAHIVHPLAGQGVNLGLADAEALATILGEARLAQRDLASPRVLQRYARARRAAVLEMLAVTDGLYRAYALQLPGWDALRAWGLEAVGRLPLLRQELVRRAAGFA